MNHSRNNLGPAVAVVALAFMLVLILLAAGGTMYLWRRQAVQQAMVADRARAQAAQATVEAERRMAQAARAETEAAMTGRSGEGDDNPESAIREVLQSQQRAWNAGDLEQFMEHYWKSEDLTFSSAGTVTRGWQDTLENYQTRYPSQADMGELSFDDLQVTPLGGDAALVLGKWQLTGASESVSGNFTLVFRRLADDWVIVHDHTSRHTP